MTWNIEFLEEAAKDIKRLDHSVRIQVLKGIQKVSRNPLPVQEGGYGKPLGSRNASNLSGFLKIKLRGAGLRIVYQLVRREGEMLLIIIGARADNEVYDTAQKRIRDKSLK